MAAYFVIGAVVLKFRSQKSGSDLIVNKIFWFALPGLVKVRYVVYLNIKIAVGIGV